MNRVREYRQRENLTQKQLAEIMEVTPDYISMIERGVRTPGFMFSKKMADYFDTTVDGIFFAKQENKTFAKSLYHRLVRTITGK